MLLIDILAEIGVRSGAGAAGIFDVWYFLLVALLGAVCWFVLALRRWSRLPPEDLLRQAEESRLRLEKRIRELEKAERDVEKGNRGG
jgi:hypothetical protein